jgi:hypothetical protein
VSTTAFGAQDRASTTADLRWSNLGGLSTGSLGGWKTSGQINLQAAPPAMPQVRVLHAADAPPVDVYLNNQLTFDGVDFRGVGPRYTGPRLHVELPDRHVDPLWGWHTRWVEHETGGYWDYCDFPLREAGEEVIDAWPMPSPDHYDSPPSQSCARRRVRRLRRWRRRRLHHQHHGLLCGMAQVLIARHR